MDPFSAEGELVNIHTAFIQSQYTSVLTDFQPSDFSDSNAAAVQILQYRAQCALGQHADVLAALTNTPTPDLAAVKLYARFQQSGAGVDAAEQLAASAGDNLTVQLLCGAILAQADNKQEQALALLARHQGSLDAVALAVQILLAQNRTAAAQKEAKAARAFAQDALLVNLAESWIGMRRGGDDYQKAFYVFEELAQAPASTSVASLVAQAVSELHMGRTEEAEAALTRALESEGGKEDTEVLANKIVLDTILGKEVKEDLTRLQALKKDHELVTGLEAKREAFQAAMGKYSPKFEV